MRNPDPDDLVERARTGDRAALARLLSLVEQGGAPAREVARITHPAIGRAVTVGITGSPGAGKSTLSSALVGRIRDEGHEVAVLAVDPTSPVTGGAILGDRVRMGDHVLDDGVFIRSMATRGQQGGLSSAVPDAVRVLDAVGLAWILIETVGVGQVGVDVAARADTTVVVVNPGWGDAVQASKAGLLEVGDIFVVNKADRPSTDETVRDLERMLTISPRSGWTPPVLRTVATTGEGVDELWSMLNEHRSYLTASGELERVRRNRLDDEIERLLVDRLTATARDIASGDSYEEMLDSVVAGELDPGSAVDRLLGTHPVRAEPR